MNRPIYGIAFAVILIASFAPVAGADPNEQPTDCLVLFLDHAVGTGISASKMGNVVWFIASSAIPGEGVSLGVIVFVDACGAGDGLLPKDPEKEIPKPPPVNIPGTSSAGFDPIPDEPILP